MIVLTQRYLKIPDIPKPTYWNPQTLTIIPLSIIFPFYSLSIYHEQTAQKHQLT